MKRFARGSFIAAALVLAQLGLGRSTAQAVEIINNAGLESGAGPKSWTLTQSITGEPASPIGIVEQNDDGNYPMIIEGELGMFGRSHKGNLPPYEGQNKAINLTLSQTVTGLGAGRTFTFTGHSLFQGNASNMLTNLLPSMGGGASPTQTFMKVEFLNSGGGVISTPVNIDMRSDSTVDAWREHTQAGFVSPTGTTQARVSFIATDMVDSCIDDCTAGKDFKFDNFSLNQTSAPFGGEKLLNGNLNEIGAPLGWEVVKTAQDNVQFSHESYAVHTGSTGMWLRSFLQGDARIEQTLPAVAGEDYTFSGWGKLQIGHCGFDPINPGCIDFMKMEFLDGSGTPIEITPGVDEVMQDVGREYTWDVITDGGQGVWQQLALPTTTAPDGTASVRVSAGAVGMVVTGTNPQSFMFDDFSLMTTAMVGLPGDFNEDGVVDAADYVRWRANDAANAALPNDGGAADQAARYALWVDNFGNTAPGSGGGAGAVPEPSSLVLLLGIALGLVAAGRRGNR